MIEAWLLEVQLRWRSWRRALADQRAVDRHSAALHALRPRNVR